MHETCLIIIHDPGMRPGPESDLPYASVSDYQEKFVIDALREIQYSSTF